MKNHISGLLTLAAVAALALSQPANADQMDASDPAFVETVTNSCPANCASVALAADPIGGKTTVEYIFNSTIPQVVAGDVLIDEFGTTTVGDVIRFENLTTTTAGAFIYSSDTSGGLAADVGLPDSFQSNTVTISENSAEFARYPASGAVTAGEPGYCPTCASQPTYGLQSAPAPLIGHGLPALLAGGILLFGVKLSQRSMKRRLLRAAIPDPQRSSLIRVPRV